MVVGVLEEAKGFPPSSARTRSALNGSFLLLKARYAEGGPCPGVPIPSSPFAARDHQPDPLLRLPLSIQSAYTLPKGQSIS